MPRLKKFQKIDHPDYAVNRIQDNIEQAFEPVTRSEILQGVLTSSVQLKTGQDNLVEHKLGREVRGYLVIAKSASATVCDKLLDATDNTNKKLFLNLQSSADVTVRLWIF